MNYTGNDKERILESLKDSILECDIKLAKDLAKRTIEVGIDPLEALDAMVQGVRKVGDKFKTGEIFLPELVGAGEAMEKASAILENEIVKTGGERKSKGVLLLGTVKGDVHSIGKDLVSSLCKANGFRVIDLGVDVSSDAFIEGINEYNPDILGMSALMTTTVREQKNVVEELKEANIRDKVKIIIGGAAASKEFADEIGADGFAPTAPMAVDLVESILNIEEGGR